MAGMIPVDASLPICPMDISLQEDDTSVALSSLESDNFVFVENTHPNKILEGLNNLRLKNEFCDVILCCGGQEFCCHRNVLASFSPYFEAMFTAEWMESQQIRVAINGVEPQMIGLMVNYAYTSKVLISTANVQALLATANLLNVMAVQEACCRYMERHMDEKNCVGIHCFAEEHSCKMLQKQSMDYILGHFSVVYQQEEFPSLSVDKLTEILSKDELRVSKEEMVFEAAMLWLNKCPTTRRQSFEKVLEQIRLSHINPAFLHDVIECLDVVKESQGCQRIISEAKNQHLLPYSHRAQPRRATAPLEGPRELHSTPQLRCFPAPISTPEGHLQSSPEATRAPPRALCKILTSLWLCLRDPRSVEQPTDPCTLFTIKIGPVIVMVAGRDDKGIICSAESFDPLSSQFETLASLPFAIHRHGLVVSGFTLYLAGGEFSDGSTSKDMWRYDPSHDSWLKMASMNAARYDFGLVMLDGYVFAVGGWNEETCVNSVERYDPDTDAWLLMESVGMPEEFCVHAVVALDGVIYVIEDGSITQPTHMYKYNPNTCVWTQVAPMHFSRSGSASCTLEGKIYVIGGKDSAFFMNQVECYSPTTNQWNTCSPMKKQRCHPGIAVVDGKIYVLGGLEGKGRFLHTIERYCEDRDTWEIVAEMPTGRSCFSCASLRLRKDGHAINKAATADNVPVN